MVSSLGVLSLLIMILSKVWCDLTKGLISTLNYIIIIWIF